jgi:hypothetical protein
MAAAIFSIDGAMPPLASICSTVTFDRSCLYSSSSFWRTSGVAAADTRTAQVSVTGLVLACCVVAGAGPPHAAASTVAAPIPPARAPIRRLDNVVMTYLLHHVQSLKGNVAGSDGIKQQPAPGHGSTERGG